jgi:hypothetical protein
MILTALLDNKEYAQYDMPKTIKKDYRTVLRHLKLLKHYEMIRLIREEPAKKGGKERKIFGLTVKGLLQALKEDCRSLPRFASAHLWQMETLQEISGKTLDI